MNRLFVNIKVDREERPDLDTVYQQALAVMGQQGGWPLTMFLTPSGEPFWGGTYFPPAVALWPTGVRRCAEAGGTSSGAAAASGWRATATRSPSALRRLAEPEPGDAHPAPTLAAAWREQIADRFDTVHGGPRRRAQIPAGAHAAADLGRRPAHRRPDTASIASVHTLARICQGGIYDHLGGGFARYSTDAHWLVPHFEKMLYDNAQLLELLALGACRDRGAAVPQRGPRRRWPGWSGR